MSLGVILTLSFAVQLLLVLSYVCLCDDFPSAGPMVVFPMGVLFINVGKDINEMCNTEKSQPMATNITVTLKRPESSEIMTVASSNGSSQQIVMFDIPTANLSQNGTVYNCTAINSIGSTTVSFVLVVRGKGIPCGKQ